MNSAMKAAVAAVVLTGVLATPATAQEGEAMLSEGWWVVLGARPAPDGNDPGDPALDAKARRCGVEPFGDFSSKFEGFRPGLVVVVAIDAYRTKAEAAETLAKAKRCIPDAYLKYGRYAGE